MIFNYLTLVAGLINIASAIFVWSSSPKKLANIGFAIVTLVMGVYVLFNFFFQISPTETLLKLIFAIGVFAVSSLFIWPYSLTHEKTSWKFIFVIILLYLSSLFMSYVSFADGQLVKTVYSPENVILGPFFKIYALYLTSLLVGLLVYLYLTFKNTIPDLKQRLLYSVIGFFIFITTLLTVSIILPSIGYTTLAILDGPSTLIFIGFTAYAIVSKKLFGIRVILTEAAVTIVLVTLFLFLVTSQTIGDWTLRGSILIIVAYGGYLIIKSVQDEISKNEQLRVLSTQLEQANGHLKDLDKMKTEFVSLASHELLTPVSAIEGYLSMMLDEHLVKLEDPKAVQYMDRVYRSAKRLARLIADMLNISRIEEGRLLVEKKNVDMTELIKQVIEELKFKAEEHKQRIEFAGAESEKLKAESQFMTYADPDKIKEVLVNIIGNSIKYTMNPGTITVTIEKVPTKVLTDEWGKLEAVILASTVDDQESIHAVADEHMKQIVGDQQYLIKVKDQGIGIPPEELPKLFKKFHRVGDFSTAESQGTGLGLYITRALVELHHGRVWPDSEGQGKGSTFTFSLPTIEAKQAIIDTEAQSQQTKEQLKPLAKPMGNDEIL